jgi:hypothetical protein
MSLFPSSIVSSSLSRSIGLALMTAGLLAASAAHAAPFQPGYVGCYVDGGNRTLPNYIGDRYTAATCIQYARTYGYRYAGLQYWGQCFVGNSLNAARVADSECNTPCDANPSEMCGSAWRNSVYDVRQYQGCFTDGGAAGRALPAYFGDRFTKETCVATAAAYGYRYAGLQYWGQCFGGNTVGHAQVADSECTLPCDANQTQSCGGVFRNLILSTTP